VALKLGSVKLGSDMTVSETGVRYSETGVRYDDIFSNWGPIWRYSAVVLKENFLVTAKHLPKKQHDAPEEKNFGW